MLQFCFYPFSSRPNNNKIHVLGSCVILRVALMDQSVLVVGGLPVLLVLFEQGTVPLVAQCSRLSFSTWTFARFDLQFYCTKLSRAGGRWTSSWVGPSYDCPASKQATVMSRNCSTCLPLKQVCGANRYSTDVGAGNLREKRFLCQCQCV